MCDSYIYLSTRDRIDHRDHGTLQSNLLWPIDGVTASDIV